MRYFFYDHILKMGLQIIFITAITFSMCCMCKSDEMRTVMEGDHVQLHFPYPCDSTRITLQCGLRDPFYTLTDSELISLPSDQENRFHVKNHNESNQCSLHLEIDPVVRSDAGTFIRFAYGADHEIYIYRIGFHVEFPPGKVSCTPSEDHTVGKWAALSCIAPVGSLSGQISCYQNEKRMPPLTAPIESNWYLKQTIIVHKSAYPVFCCSSFLEQTKDRCECNDFHLDPTNGDIESKMIGPCGSTTPAYIQVETSEIVNRTSKLIHVPTVMMEIITNKNNSNNSVSKKMVVLSTLLAITTCISIILLILWFYGLKSYKNIHKSVPKLLLFRKISSRTPTSYEYPKSIQINISNAKPLLSPESSPTVPNQQSQHQIFYYKA